MAALFGQVVAVLQLLQGVLSSAPTQFTSEAIPPIIVRGVTVPVVEPGEVVAVPTVPPDEYETPPTELTVKAAFAEGR